MSAVKDSDTFYFIRDTWTEVCGADLNIRKVMVWGNGATPFIYYSPDNNNRIVYVLLLRCVYAAVFFFVSHMTGFSYIAVLILID